MHGVANGSGVPLTEVSRSSAPHAALQGGTKGKSGKTNSNPTAKRKARVRGSRPNQSVRRRYKCPVIVEARIFKKRAFRGMQSSGPKGSKSFWVVFTKCVQHHTHESLRSRRLRGAGTPRGREEAEYVKDILRSNPSRSSRRFLRRQLNARDDSLQRSAQDVLNMIAALTKRRKSLENPMTYLLSALTANPDCAFVATVRSKARAKYRIVQ